MHSKKCCFPFLALGWSIHRPALNSLGKEYPRKTARDMIFSSLERSLIIKDLDKVAHRKKCYFCNCPEVFTELGNCQHIEVAFPENFKIFYGVFVQGNMEISNFVVEFEEVRIDSWNFSHFGSTIHCEGDISTEFVLSLGDILPSGWEGLVGFSLHSISSGLLD